MYTCIIVYTLCLCLFYYSALNYNNKVFSKALYMYYYTKELVETFCKLHKDLFETLCKSLNCIMISILI